MGRHTKKSKHTGRTVLSVLLALVLIGGAAAAAGYFGIKNFNKALDPDSNETVEFEIAAGSSTTGIANKLQKAGLVKSANIFKFKTKFNHLDGKYQAGTYVLKPSMTMEEIMTTLQKGRNPQVKFTIAEGLTLTQVGEKLKEQGIVASAEDFYKALEDDYDYDFLPKNGFAVGKISAKGNRLEGYLYPETYMVDEGSDAHTVIDAMLSHFQSACMEKLKAQVPEGYTFHQIMILASMVEEEWGVDEERARIAGVFWNRLNFGMRFESNVTIEYVLGHFDAKYDSPYNTYLYPGLPAGPICSPSVKSIQAALAPEKHNYLYFCLKGDGTYRANFAETYEGHLKNVEIWKNNPYDY